LLALTDRRVKEKGIWNNGEGKRKRDGNEEMVKASSVSSDEVDFPGSQ